jgi:hypothetical protein
MSMNRKGFFKTLFGGFVAASAAPSLVKAEDNPQPSKDLSLSREALRIDEHGNFGIGGSGHVGLGTSTPMSKLHVKGIIFHVNDRMLEMSGDENGDFKMQWLDPKQNETANTIVIHKPKDDPWKREFITIR